LQALAHASGSELEMGGTLANVAITLWALGLAANDLRSRRLPNTWLIAGIAFGVVIYVATSSMPLGVGLLEAALAMALALACFVPFYLAGWMGAGDVKFLAVIGWLGGFEVLFAVVLFGSLLAGFVALVLRLLPVWGARIFSGRTLSQVLRARVPYGACLALALVLLVWGLLNEFLPVIRVGWR